MRNTKVDGVMFVAIGFGGNTVWFDDTTMPVWQKIGRASCSHITHPYHHTTHSYHHTTHPYHHTTHPYHNITHPYINWNDQNDDKEEDDEYDDEYDNEYDSDNEMYTKNNTIENSMNIIADKSYGAHTTVHTTDHTDKYTIIKTPWLPPITNTINESSIYSEINIIEDVPNNNINGKNAAKRKEKASRRKKAASIQRTENTICDKCFKFPDGESSNDTDSSNSSNCNCDLHQDCPQHQWEHWSQRTFNYDKTYNYDRVDPVDTYMLDGQDHWYFNTYIPRMLGGTMPP